MQTFKIIIATILTFPFVFIETLRKELFAENLFLCKQKI